MTEPVRPSSPVEVGELLRMRAGKAYHAGKLRSNGQPVLVARMATAYRQDPVAEKRMRREFGAAKKVSSPYVIRYLGLIEDPKQGPAVVVEPERGMPLRSHLALRGKLSIEPALLFMTQVAEGLLACHRAGVVHRDLSPDTIRVGPGGVQITDFGLANFQQATALTLTGTMLQSPEYAPPEAFTGASDDLRADVYSAGVVFWEALAGRSPFEGQPLAELIESKKGEAPHVSAVEPACPPWLDQLICAMLAADAGERPASFAEVLEALQTRSFAPRPVAGAGGRCMQCGHRLLRRVAYCVFCGEEKARGLQTGDVTIHITNVPDVEATAALLESTFPGAPLAPLRPSLKTRRVYLGTNFAPEEAAWLQERLRETGVTSQIEAPHRVFERLAWFFAGVALLLALVVAESFAVSWSIADHRIMSVIPRLQPRYVATLNLVIALGVAGLYLTLARYRLGLTELLLHGWRSVRETVADGPVILGRKVPGIVPVVARAGLVYLAVAFALGAVGSLCNFFAFSVGEGQPFMPMGLVAPVAMLAIVWVLTGKAAEPVLYDRRASALPAMLPAAEYELWKLLQAELRGVKLAAYGWTAAAAAEVFDAAQAVAADGVAVDECRAAQREGLLAVVRAGGAIRCLRKQGEADAGPLVQEQLNEALRAVGLMRTALHRLQRAAASPKAADDPARTFVDLRYELQAMGAPA